MVKDGVLGEGVLGEFGSEEEEMGTFGNYLENELLDHVFGKGAYTPPTIYVGLSAADPTDDASGISEPAVGAYARVATTGADWSAASSGALSNAAAITFPESTASWGTMTHFILMDAATDGNMLGYGTLTTERAITAAGIVPRFAIGELDVTLD